MTRRKNAERRAPAAWGTIERLPSGRWRAFYRKDAVKYSAPHTFATKDDANAWLSAERADRSRGVWVDPRAGQVTVADYARDLIDARTDLAPRTRELSLHLIDRWIALPVESDRGRRVELGSIHLADLTTADVRAWFGALRDSARRSSAERMTTRTTPRSSMTRAEHPARAWARDNDMHVSAGGRLPRAVLDAWRAAGSPAAIAARRKARPGNAETYARAWALSTGHPVAPTGRVAATTVAAWRVAGAPSPAPAPPRPVADNAGETTAASTYRVLHMVLATAVRDGLIVSNPANLPGAGRAKHRTRGVATPAEVDALANAMPKHLAAAVYVAAWSSLRYGELFGLARRHVNLEAGTVKVERTLQRSPSNDPRFGKTKNTGSLRTVHLPAFVVTMLAEHMAKQPDADPGTLLFTTPTGTAVSNAHVSYHFRRARAVVGRDDLTWHDLRHTGATLAYRAGASVPEVQARLGHTTMRAALIYAHVADDADSTLAARMDALYGSPAPSSRPHLRAV